MWNGTDEPISRAGIEMQTQRRGMWTQEVGGTNWEMRIDMMIYEIASQWEAAIKHRKHSSVLCDDLKGGMGVGWREVQEGGDMCVCVCVCVQLIHFVVQQKLTQHCKAINIPKKAVILGGIINIRKFLFLYIGTFYSEYLSTLY